MKLIKISIFWLMLGGIVQCANRTDLTKKNKIKSPAYVIQNIDYNFKSRLFGPLFKKSPDWMFSVRIEISVTLKILEPDWALQKVIVNYDKIRNRNLKAEERTKVKDKLKEIYNSEQKFFENKIEVIPIVPIFVKRKTKKNEYTKNVNLYWGTGGLNYIAVTVDNKELFIQWFRAK
ncbi:MAG: hypothetical protein ABUK01_13845 [Leptospirales bacterium]